VKLLANKMWRCPQGHQIEQSYPFTVTAHGADGDLVPSKPVCQVCYVSWIQATFPIAEEP